MRKLIEELIDFQDGYLVIGDSISIDSCKRSCPVRIQTNFARLTSDLNISQLSQEKILMSPTTFALINVENNLSFRARNSSQFVIVDNDNPTYESDRIFV